MNYLQDLAIIRKMPKEDRRLAVHHSIYTNDIDAAMLVLANAKSLHPHLLNLARYEMLNDVERNQL